MKTVAAPPFAESVSEGDVRWEKAVGDYVEVDEVIAEIETDKTALQVPAPVGGVLEELLVADGDTVTPGMDLARIRVSGPGTGATPTPSSTTEPATQETTPPPPAVEATPTPSPIPSSPPLPPPLPVEPMSTSPPPLPLTAPSLGGVSRAEKRVSPYHYVVISPQ
jgi:2-oxoglutarate dehydrogenase E2 component (dihydrolipoamide succinyltransferase)